MMEVDLLPQSLDDFRDVSYWNKFFAKRGTQNSFEWYGDYKDVQPLLEQVIKSNFPVYLSCKDQLHFKQNLHFLNVGCGNSDLPFHMCEDGFKNIVNTDFSPVVIQAMQQKCRTLCSSCRSPTGKSHGNVLKSPEYCGLMFDCVDVRYASLEKLYGPSAFDIIIDKGFLDAALSKEATISVDSADCLKIKGSNETKNSLNCSNYFDSVMSVLKEGGCFLVITLAQEYIVKHMVRYLFSKTGSAIRIAINPFRLGSRSPSVTAGKPLDPFLFAFTKPTHHGTEIRSSFSSDRCYVERSSKGLGEYIPVGQIPKKIRNISRARYLENVTASHMPGRRFDVDLYDPKISCSMYTITMYDNCKLRDNPPTTTVFISPPGEELSWVHSTAEGNQDLADRLNTKRLLLVAVGRVPPAAQAASSDCLSTEYTGLLLTSVQEEISAHVSELALPGSPPNIRVVAAAYEHDFRVVSTIESPISGKIIVRDARPLSLEKTTPPMNQRITRQLVFGGNPRCIQSEVNYMLEVSNPSDESSGKPALDFTDICCSYHEAISLSIGFLPEEKFGSFFNDDEGSSYLQICILGLGGGVLPSIIKELYKGLLIHMTCVELDEQVREVATKYFAFSEDDTMRCVINDGLKYLEDSEGTMDIIIVDISSGTCLSNIVSPKKQFLEEHALKVYLSRLSSGGLLVFNFNTRCAVTRLEVYRLLHKTFPAVFCIRDHEDVNEVILCVNGQVQENDPEKLKNLLMERLCRMSTLRHEWRLRNSYPEPNKCCLFPLNAQLWKNRLMAVGAETYEYYCNQKR